MRECQAEVDPGERMFCKSKHAKGHVTKDSLLATHMCWSALHCIVELHLSGLHREKRTRKTCGGLLEFLVASADWG